MIKTEHKVDEEKGLLMFAFQASQEADYDALDLLCEVLSRVPDSKVAFVQSNRLVGHFKGLVSPTD